MVVSSNYNLIPYPAHHYPVQAFHPENTVAVHHPGQDTVGRNNVFGQPRLETATRAGQFGSFSANRYDITQCLSYGDADHVGLMVNIYA
jgi:hypothetical protein